MYNQPIACTTNMHNQRGISDSLVPATKGHDRPSPSKQCLLLLRRIKKHSKQGKGGVHACRKGASVVEDLQAKFRNKRPACPHTRGWKVRRSANIRHREMQMCLHTRCLKSSHKGLKNQSQEA